MARRVYQSKNKQKVLQHALKENQQKISIWKSEDGKWHAAEGPNHVPDYAIEVEHIR